MSFKTRALCHGLDLASPVTQSENQPVPEEEKSKADGVYDSGCLTLSLDLLLRKQMMLSEKGMVKGFTECGSFPPFFIELVATTSTLYCTSPCFAKAKTIPPADVEPLCCLRMGTRKEDREGFVENHNLTAKGEIKALGFPNINNESICRVTQSIQRRHVSFLCVDCSSICLRKKLTD